MPLSTIVKACKLLGLQRFLGFMPGVGPMLPEASHVKEADEDDDNNEDEEEENEEEGLE